MVVRQHLEALRIKLTSTYQRLDTLLPHEGPMLAHWRIRLNPEPEELETIRNS